MNSNSKHRQKLAEFALIVARRGDFDLLRDALHDLTNPHESMNADAADCALKGDFERLLSQLRSGEASPEVMALAADIIEGKVKRAKGKPKESARTFAQGLDAALRVRELERQGWSKRTAAVVKVAEEFGMSKTAVQAALAAWDGPSLIRMEEFYKEIAADARRMRDAAAVTRGEARHFQVNADLAGSELSCFHGTA